MPIAGGVNHRARAQMCQAFSLKEIDNMIRGLTAPAIDVSAFLAFARSHFLK